MLYYKFYFNQLNSIQFYLVQMKIAVSLVPYYIEILRQPDTVEPTIR